MMKFEISKKIIATTILVSLIFIVIISIIFSLINEKARIQSALNLSQHNREQLLKPEKVTESLLLVEARFKEYSLTFKRPAFEQYKKEVKNLVENIRILNQVLTQDSAGDDKNIGRIFGEKTKEADIYVKLKLITDSLLMSMGSLEKNQDGIDKYIKKWLERKVDTLSVTETRETHNRGLLGKLKTAIVGEKIKQNTDTKILVQPQDISSFMTPDSVVNDKINTSQANIQELIQKNQQLKLSELKLINLNNRLIMEIRKLIDEIRNNIKEQESVLNKSFLNSVRHSTNFLQNVLIFLMLLACILVGYILMLAYKNHKFQEHIVSLNQTIMKDSIQKDKFFSIIGHDLIAPFNALLGFSNLLSEAAKNESKEDIIEYSSIVNQSSKRIFNLLQNLLVWAKMQNGKTKFSPRSVNIHDLISSSILIIFPIAQGKNIELKWSVSPKLEATLDSTMISSVLQNLITNAIKFTQTGGQVSIESYVNSDNLNFVISDSGIGMDKNQLDKLFKLDSTSSTRGTENEVGTGLGLLICKEFVDSHHGQIWAKSKPGEGTTFYVSIPLTL